MALTRKGVTEALTEAADVLNIREHIKALQTGQRELADAVADIQRQLHEIRADMKVQRAEAQVDALRATQEAVGNVQGAIFDRLEKMAINIAVAEERSAQQLKQIADRAKE